MTSVTSDRFGLNVAGKRLFLLSGQIHYFRWPRAEWRHLLLTAKAGGLNAVDTVIPWNLHEPEPGRYDFEEEADLPGWLDLCHELSLYAIVRPGPYICAEWENGGFPAWLTGQGLRLRTDDPAFLLALERWFDVLIPILARRQLDGGGPVILTQIENEHWASGVYGHDAHQQTLARMLAERGISVPFYTCMGPTPPSAGGPPTAAEFRNGWSGIAEKLRATRAVWPDNPMIVSELWSGWFDNWGASAHNGKTPAALDRVLHELTAIGASGFSHWMWAGGTNFGWWGGRTVGGDTVHMTTSYDYDAIVDEYGRPTPKFHVARRHHLFLASLGAILSPLLAEAREGGPQVLIPAGVRGRSAGGDPPYRLAQNGDFSAAFLQNTGLERQTVQVFHADPPVHLAVEVEAGSIKPIFANLPLAAGLTLRHHTCRILGFWPQPGMLVLYGCLGEAGQVALQNRAGWRMQEGIEPTPTVRLDIEGEELKLRFWISDRPVVVRTESLLIVILTQARAERFWPQPGGPGFICGPDLALEDGRTSAEGALPFYRIDANGALTEASPPARRFDLAWETLAVAEIASVWPAGASDFAHPPSFEEAGCWLDYGVYQASFHLDRPLDTTLAAPWLSDRGIVFIDGRRLGTVGVDPGGPHWTLPVRLAPGDHELRLLVDNLGRFNYGSHTGERKGLLGDLYWGGEQIDITKGWVALWQEAAFAGEAIADAKPAHVRADAAGVDLSNFGWQGGHVWLLREIEVGEGERVLLQLTGDRNTGALFANGQVVERFSRHHGGGFIKRDLTPWLRPGGNVLALHIENYSGLAWRGTLLSYRLEDALAASWRFRPGLHPAPAPPQPDHPRFYRARFAYDPAAHGPGPFALAAAGLRKGHFWLNGRSLGRYWQIGPQEFYKTPASWLQPENELLVLEEEDGRVDESTIRRLTGF